MLWKTIRFVLTCLLLWPVSIFVANQISSVITLALWWMAHQSGATHLPRAIFHNNASLPLALVDGFLLGLIPIVRLKTIVLDAFTVGRIRSQPSTQPENNFSRPILWAWVLPTLFFVLRFATHGTHVEESVLGGTMITSEPGRLAYFFGPWEISTGYTNLMLWFYDRLYFTLPMLFTGSYALAVIVRHHLEKLRLPTHPSSDPTQPTSDPK